MSQPTNGALAPVYLTVTRLTETRRNPTAPDKISLDVNCRADNGKGAFFILSDGLRQRVPWKVGDRLMGIGTALYHPSMPGINLFANEKPWPIVPLPPNRQPVIEEQPMNNVIAMPSLPASLDLAKSPLTMSSREIAELCGKDHKNVIRDIREMLSQLGDGSDLGHEQIQGVREEKDVRGYTAQFDLSKDLTLTLISGYNTKLRKRIIDRWLELEGQAAPIAIPTNLRDALLLAAELEGKREAAEARALEAERTKSMIGSRREAQAMAAASVKAREVERLKVKLDESHRYASVKRMQHAYPGQTIKWQEVKKASQALGLPIRDVDDPNFGSVHTYHAAAWHKAYALEIPA
jgi:phage regulator Rha-like protein